MSLVVLSYYFMVLSISFHHCGGPQGIWRCAASSCGLIRNGHDRRGQHFFYHMMNHRILEDFLGVFPKFSDKSYKPNLWPWFRIRVLTLVRDGKLVCFSDEIAYWCRGRCRGRPKDCGSWAVQHHRKIMEWVDDWHWQNLANRSVCVHQWATALLFLAAPDIVETVLDCQLSHRSQCLVLGCSTSPGVWDLVRFNTPQR